MIIKGACFDSSNIDSEKHRFNNIELTKHDISLEEDYKLLRGDGFELFRESAWLNKSFKGGINWNWIDRLAKISEGQIQLAISHYDWIYNRNDYIGFVVELAKRYKGVFHSYIPFVESGTYCHMLCEYLFPRFSNWWEAWRVVSGYQELTATILKKYDPSCKIALSEPFNSFNSWDDEARPFNTLLGIKDEIAENNECFSHKTGKDSLLDIIGINILHYNPEIPVYENILEASGRWPNKEIMVSETTQVWHQQISPKLWMKYMETQIETAQGAGVNINKLVWCPVISMFSHNERELIGGSLYDLERKRLW